MHPSPRLIPASARAAQACHRRPRCRCPRVASASRAEATEEDCCFRTSAGACPESHSHRDAALAYAVWVGVGAALTVLYAMSSGQEAVSAVKLLFVAMIVGGVIGLKLAS